MKLLSAVGLLCAALLVPLFANAGGKDVGGKEALQALQDYIGHWKGNGTSDKDRSEIWKEAATWSWRLQRKRCGLGC